MKYTQLLLLRASIQETNIHKYTHSLPNACPGRHPQVSTHKYTQAHTDNHCSIKVIESWQISAAAESLTWGCWIDNPSIGTLLAFSSFWEEQNERHNCANAITSLVNIKLELILHKQQSKIFFIFIREVKNRCVVKKILTNEFMILRRASAQEAQSLCVYDNPSLITHL